MNARQSKTIGGFTLLEVLLSMAIAALVLGAVTMAINFHLRVVERGRRDVEEAQLARALLRHIADDLRAGVLYQPLDTSALAGIAGSGGSGGSTSGSGGSGGSTPAATASVAPTAGSSNTSGSGEGSTSPSDTSGDLAESTVLSTTPGLYGNRYELQVDVSKLPRIDQYEQLLVDFEGRPGDLVSDVKTVAYYMGTDTKTTVAGLMRRELDRAATAWAIQNGGMQELEQYQQLLAPEVLTIEFSYFDGLDWYEEWDSSVLQGLPLAVEVAVAIAKAGEPLTDVSLIDLTNVTGEEPYRVYRLLVHLPAAKPASAETTATGETGSGSTETLP
jgi:prepilin-type N-terminal cleavage/methylation domain-containing protein